MTLVEAEHFVDRSLCSLLERDHLARPGAELLVVGGVLKLPVPLVAGTLPRVLTPVQAVAEGLTFGFLEILPNVVVHDFVRLDVLHKS